MLHQLQWTTRVARWRGTWGRRMVPNPVVDIAAEKSHGNPATTGGSYKRLPQSNQQIWSQVFPGDSSTCGEPGLIIYETFIVWSRLWGLLVHRTSYQLVFNCKRWIWHVQKLLDAIAFIAFKVLAKCACMRVCVCEWVNKRELASKLIHDWL